MSQLRQRFIRDLQIRNYSPRTIKAYISSLLKLAQHHNKCPSQITEEELKAYIAMLIEDKKSWSMVNQLISAINRLFVDTLGRPYPLDRIKRPKKVSKIPTILSVSEVKAILSAIKNLKHRAIIMTIYSGGMRIGEVCELRIADIDSKRKRISIRNAKGKKDREVILSDKLVVILRQYYRIYRPENYLFSGFKNGSPYSRSSIQKILKRAVIKSAISKPVCVHTLRHSYATHLMDKGIDVRVIQSLMGHKSIKTTMRYCHLSTNSFINVRSPLDDILIH